MKLTYKVYRQGVKRDFFMGTYTRKDGESFKDFKVRACKFYGLNSGRTKVLKLSVNNELPKV